MKALLRLSLCAIAVLAMATLAVPPANAVSLDAVVIGSSSEQAVDAVYEYETHFGLIALYPAANHSARASPDLSVDRSFKVATADPSIFVVSQTRLSDMAGVGIEPVPRE